MAMGAMSEWECRRRFLERPPRSPRRRWLIMPADGSRRVPTGRGSWPRPTPRKTWTTGSAPPERIPSGAWSRASPQRMQCSAARGSARRDHEVLLHRPANAPAGLLPRRRPGPPSPSGGGRGPRAIRDATPHRDPGLRLRRHALARLPRPATGDQSGSSPAGGIRDGWGIADPLRLRTRLNLTLCRFRHIVYRHESISGRGSKAKAAGAARRRDQDGLPVADGHKTSPSRDYRD